MSAKNGGENLCWRIWWMFESGAGGWRAIWRRCATDVTEHPLFGSPHPLPSLRNTYQFTHRLQIALQPPAPDSNIHQILQHRFSPPFFALIDEREEWRRKSVLEDLVDVRIWGRGLEGYLEAVRELIRVAERRERMGRSE